MFEIANPEGKPQPEFVTLFCCLEIAGLHELVLGLEGNQSEDGLSQFFEAMLSLQGETKDTAVKALLVYAEQHKDYPLFALILELAELVANPRFVPMPADTLLLAPEHSEGALHYPIPVPDFKFSVYQNQQNTALTTTGAEILLAIDTPLTVNHSNSETLTVEKASRCLFLIMLVAIQQARQADLLAPITDQSVTYLTLTDSFCG